MLRLPRALRNPMPQARRLGRAAHLTRWHARATKPAHLAQPGHFASFGVIRALMSFNTFGHLFRVTTFGESHGPAIGCVVDGCPPGIALSEADIQPYLDRRRPGQSRFTTQRQEPDAVRILSGVFVDEATGAQVTTGTPIALVIDNVDQRSQGLFRDQGQVSARPRRLHLRCEIRPARLSRRRPAIRARNGNAGCRRCDRAQGRARPDRARRAGADRAAPDRSHALGLGRGRAQSVLLSRCQDGRVLRRLSRRRAQAAAPRSAR